MNEDQAALALGEFFADGFKPVSFIVSNGLEGFWFHDTNGKLTKRLNDSEIESLLYLLDIYVNGE